MKIKPMFAISLITFGLSVISFLAMRVYESHIAGWCAAGFGFVAIITMMVPGLEKLRSGKISKPKA